MELIKVRMLTEGPNGNFKVGQVRDVDSIRAADLIDNGDAEVYVENEEKPKPKTKKAKSVGKAKK